MLSNRFRWVFCQLQSLRNCLPPSVRRALDELPESLDATYERVLEEIKKPNREHARRLLQCLVVAVRTLRVSELAEVLAVDFDDYEGIPKLKPNWRWEDEEQALLSSCSSLIAIVESDESRVVQFSHFSVKEFLTSARLATSSGDISRYHIDLGHAHTILAQACMGVLLRSDDRVEESDVGNSSPLARYAAEHWIVHARDEMVSSCIRKAMEYLFDVDKPYFAAWLELYDIDTDTPSGTPFHMFAIRTGRGFPLYYAVRCGFQDLVKNLVRNDPNQVNATGGYFRAPLIAALGGEHFQTAKFLYENGADVNARMSDGSTPLHIAARIGRVEVIHELVKHGADVNARKNDNTTTLHEAARSGSVEAIHVLLEHGVDVNARKTDDTTTLHEAAQSRSVEAVRVLFKNGVDVNARSTGYIHTSESDVFSGKHQSH